MIACFQTQDILADALINNLEKEREKLSRIEYD